MIISAEVRNSVIQAFGESHASRGWHSFQSGRVKLQKVTPQGDELLIDAVVQGKRPRPYQVFVYLDPEQPEYMSGKCNCPVGHDCKHCAATAYAYFFQRARARGPEQEIEKWFELLLSQKQTPPEPGDESEQVLYLFSLKPRELQPEITAIEVRLLKRGGYGPVHSLDFSELSAEDASPADQDLGRLLLASQPDASFDQPASVRLRGAPGRLALEQLLASGRCHLDSPEGMVLRPGMPRPLGFKWIQGPKGWQLQPQSEPAFSRLFLLDTLWYLDARNQSIGQLASEIPQAFHEALLKAPVVPSDQIEDVARRLLDSLPEVPLPLPEIPELEVEEIRGLEPIPHLTLRSTVLGANDPEAEEVTLLHLAQLEFVYDEVYLSPSDSTGFIQIEQDDQFYRLQRDLPAEEGWRHQLSDSGLQPLPAGKLAETGVFFHLSGASGQARAQLWDRWLSDDLPRLEEAGWVIHVASDFALSIYESGSDWNASLAAGADEGWFDLSLGVDIEGHSVNLLPMLVNLLQTSDPDSLREQESLLLPLGQDEGGHEQWLRVPAARLQPILNTLVELYDREPLNPEGQLSLSWYESLHLDPLLDTPGLKWQGAEQVRELTKRLKDFTGIATVPVPPGFATELRPYQQEGLNWLQFLREFSFHGILADDMGLGKTIQTLAHLLAEKQSGRADQPSLVIVPTSLLGNWQREAQRFAPELKVMVLHGSGRQSDFALIPEHDLVITTYALVRLDLTAHLHQTYHCLILDEGQFIKNPRSKTAKALFQLQARQRLVLSGTPMENHLAELWSIFHFLMPGFLGSIERFTRLFRTPIEKTGDPVRREALRQRLRPFMLRRTKLQVERDLPPKTEIVQYVSLEGPQRDLYETVRLAMDARVRAEISKLGLGRSQIMILDALLKLRQICCDPRLLQMEQARLVKESAKLELLMEMVPEMVEEGRRILIFSQFVSMIDLIEGALVHHKIPTSRLTGSTRDRDGAVRRFQEGRAPVFLISLKAGGVGLNLTAADTVIHYDPWWNPAAENQATDRAYRIGQDKPVFVYKLITEQTVEEKILALQAKKSQLAEGIFSDEAGEFNLEAEELLALLD